MLDYKYNLNAAKRIAHRLRWLNRIRPAVLVSPFYSLMNTRRIIEIDGLKIFLDPTGHLGRTILSEGSYEPETADIFREHIKSGDAVLDIGANEGYFSALASKLVGPNGTVVAVEPQSRLRDVLEINLALNQGGRTFIQQKAVSERDGKKLEIALFPTHNSGASSLVHAYRFSSKTETVTTITPASLLAQSGLNHFDFVKIDVEGFEPEVVRAMVPLLREKRISKILLDYHAAILMQRKVDPKITNDLILDYGYSRIWGNGFSGHVLYCVS